MAFARPQGRSAEHILTLEKEMKELERLLESKSREEVIVSEELKKAKQQATYYGNLVKEMKKTMSPSDLSSLLKSL